MTKKKTPAPPAADKKADEAPESTPPHRIVDPKAERLRATPNWTPSQLKSRRRR